MDNLTQEDIDIRNNILYGSYWENYAHAKLLYKSKDSKADFQWKASQSILNDILTFNNSLKQHLCKQ